MDNQCTQQEVCKFRFDEIQKKIDSIAKHDTENQDQKINTLDKMMMRFEMLLSKQDDTNTMIFNTHNETTKLMFDKFEEYKKENVSFGRERDKIIQSLVENMARTTEELIKIHEKQADFSTEIAKISEEVKASNAKNKIDMQDIAKNVFTFLITSGAIGFISFLFYTYAKSL